MTKVCMWATIVLGGSAAALWIGHLAGPWAVLLPFASPLVVLWASRTEQRWKARDGTGQHQNLPSRWLLVPVYLLLAAVSVVVILRTASDPMTELWPTLSLRGIDISGTVATVMSLIVAVVALIGLGGLLPSADRPQEPSVGPHSARLDRINFEIHDAYFDLDALVHDVGRSELRLSIYPERTTGRFILRSRSPGPDRLPEPIGELIVRTVVGVRIEDGAEIRWFPIDELEFDPDAGEVTLRSHVPLEITIDVTEFDIELVVPARSR